MIRICNLRHICTVCTIFLLVRTRGGGPDFQLDPDELDPSYNYDFTNVSEDGETYMRGGKPYKLEEICCQSTRCL